LIDVNPNGEKVAHPVPVAVDAPVTPATSSAWTSRDGYPARGGGGQRAHRRPAQMADISVARVHGDRTAMFAAYRWQIVVSVAVSALVAALLASVMLLRGLRPLRNIAAHAALVRPGKLGQSLKRAMRRRNSAADPGAERHAGAAAGRIRAAVAVFRRPRA
jgi:two-component system heavy metal sensor histidine kinase CusS